MKRSLGAKTILYPAPVLLVGTYDGDRRPNLMAVAWGGICCSSPPCVAVSLRKATYSYSSIMEREAFTVNIPSASQVEMADYFGIETGRNTNKFMRSGITAVGSDIVDAPYGEEFPVILECNLLNHIEIGLHTQFIGEIMEIDSKNNYYPLFDFDYLTLNHLFISDSRLKFKTPYKFSFYIRNVFSLDTSGYNTVIDDKVSFGISERITYI